MFAYYLRLALSSLKRHQVLTVLMVLALGLGIGASITTLTVLRLLDGDPIPQKSAQLFYPQVDPYSPAHPFSRSGKTLPWLLSYPDAMSLIHAPGVTHATALAYNASKLSLPDGKARPFYTSGLMASSGIFAAFAMPFKYGGGWSAQDEAAHAQVVVIADYLNDQWFGGADSVGRTIRINDQDFRIVGVMRHWAPQPRFYAAQLASGAYGKGDPLVMPLDTALSLGFYPKMSMTYGTPPDTHHFERAQSIWLGAWVQLDTAEQQRAYGNFLSAYAAQQVVLDRFHYKHVRLNSLHGWMVDQHMVPDDVRMQALLAFGFLFICVVNTVGLLLAKCLRRAREIGVRRALGASRAAVFAQFMTESAMVGVAGGVLGLLLTECGLWAIRHQAVEYAELVRLDLTMFGVNFLIAVAASLLAGILPAWRACTVAPAPQLKAS